MRPAQGPFVEFFSARKFQPPTAVIARFRVFEQDLRFRKMARPVFKPSAQARRQVEISAAGGMGQERIAAALGIARNTLAKHFAKELEAGSARREVDIIFAMYKTALKGNVAAQRAFLTRGDIARASQSFDAPPPRRKLGKKELARIDAAGAGTGTDWGADLDPTKSTTQT